MRIFEPPYPDERIFHIVEKKKKKKKKITLINEGFSLRDFIHIDDVGKIYRIFLKRSVRKGIYDIGTVRGF